MLFYFWAIWQFFHVFLQCQIQQLRISLIFHLSSLISLFRRTSAPKSLLPLFSLFCSLWLKILIFSIFIFNESIQFLQKNNSNWMSIFSQKIIEHLDDGLAHLF